VVRFLAAFRCQNDSTAVPVSRGEKLGQMLRGPLERGCRDGQTSRGGEMVEPSTSFGAMTDLTDSQLVGLSVRLQPCIGVYEY
jgi:hypothetical protein